MSRKTLLISQPVHHHRHLGYTTTTPSAFSKSRMIIASCWYNHKGEKNLNIDGPSSSSSRRGTKYERINRINIQLQSYWILRDEDTAVRLENLIKSNVYTVRQSRNANLFFIFFFSFSTTRKRNRRHKLPSGQNEKKKIRSCNNSSSKVLCTTSFFESSGLINFQSGTSFLLFVCCPFFCKDMTDVNFSRRKLMPVRDGGLEKTIWHQRRERVNGVRAEEREEGYCYCPRVSDTIGRPRSRPRWSGNSCC